MRKRDTNPMDRTAATAATAKDGRRYADDESLRRDAALRSKDALRETMSADRQCPERPLHSPRRPRRRSPGASERKLAARRRDKGSEGAASGDPKHATRSDEPAEGQAVKERTVDLEDRLGDHPSDRLPALTEAEHVEIEARHRERCAYWDRVYHRLKMDAQACARSMQFSPLFGMPENWEDIVSKSLEDYRSGRSLMDHMGVDRLLDPATTGMLLAIRRGLVEETNATTIGEFVLIDMAVIAFANAMRLQSMIGNTSLTIEGEMFGQPTLRAKWKKEYGGRPENINGLAVEEHVARLRDRLLPLVERFHRMARESIEAIGRKRDVATVGIERAEAVSIIILAP